MDVEHWRNVFGDIKRKGILLDENVLMDNFQDVINKAFDQDMGFGYICESDHKHKARVILQGRNPFMENSTGYLNPALGDSIPYSQVYHLGWASQETIGTTFCILRHYLHLPSLDEEELRSIRVAACSLEDINSIKYKVETYEDKDGVVEKKFSMTEEIKQENYSTTIKSEVQSDGIEMDDNGQQTASKKALKKKSTQVLMEQMNKIVKPMANANCETLDTGVIVITVHKATDIEKKGVVGKADPYVTLTYGTQKEKSKTVDNNHNPVWHFTSNFNIQDDSTNEILLEVFDEDVGKDDFLGKTILNIKEIIETTSYVNKWIDLEGCKSGKVLLSAKFVPDRKASRTVGRLSLIVHKAKKIEKKNMMKKADPYVVIKLGAENFKSETVNNSQNPTWNFSVDLDVMEISPRQISFEVFDDDIGKDAAIGNFTLDLDTIMKKVKIENLWTRLENCKSGELLISANFVKSENVDEEEINNQVANIKKEIITEKVEINQSEKKSMMESTVITKKMSRVKMESFEASMDLIDPLYLDDEFVVVERKANNWFMVVSPHRNLPINVNMVPFKRISEKNSPIFIYPLPKGGFHNIKRVVHSGKGLRKCGYEKSCVLRSGEPYQFWTDAQGQNFNLGTLQAETYGPDKSWVVYREEYFKPQDYIEVTLSSEMNGPEFSGPISLYDRLNVDAA